MKRVVFPLLMLALGASLAMAQPDKTYDNPASTPAVATSKANNAGAPVKGANSFTEAQAKERIEKKGFKNISVLVKDDHGIWRGKAALSGITHDVAVDYQGNVTHK
jgi:hypothetical protein